MNGDLEEWGQQWIISGIYFACHNCSNVICHNQANKQIHKVTDWLPGWLADEKAGPDCYLSYVVNASSFSTVDFRGYKKYMVAINLLSYDASGVHSALFYIQSKTNYHIEIFTFNRNVGSEWLKEGNSSLQYADTMMTSRSHLTAAGTCHPSVHHSPSLHDYGGSLKRRQRR